MLARRRCPSNGQGCGRSSATSEEWRQRQFKECGGRSIGYRLNLGEASRPDFDPLLAPIRSQNLSEFDPETFSLQVIRHLEP